MSLSKEEKLEFEEVYYPVLEWVYKKLSEKGTSIAALKLSGSIICDSENEVELRNANYALQKENARLTELLNAAEESYNALKAKQ